MGGPRFWLAGAPIIWLLTVVILLPVGADLMVQRPAAPVIQTISMGRLPGSVALDPARSRAIVGNDGDATVSVVDLAGTRVVRTVQVGNPTTLAPLALAIDPRLHHAFVADRGDAGMPSAIWMLDSITGARLTAVRVGLEASALAVDTRQGHVFVTNERDGTVSMLDARSAATLRTITVGSAPVALAVDERTARVAVVSVGAQWGMGYSAGVASVSLLDSRSGRVLWTAFIGDGSAVLALDTRTDRIFVANRRDGTVSVLDLGSGAVLLTVPVGAAPAALAVDERRHRVFVASAGDGTLSVLDTRSGARLFTRRFEPTAMLDFPRPYALAVDEARDRVYLSSWGGLDHVVGVLGLHGADRLYVLDARTGTVERTLAVGVAPAAVSVEAGSGRVVVVNEGGWVAHPADGWSTQWLQRLQQALPLLGADARRTSGGAMVLGSLSLITSRI